MKTKPEAKLRAITFMQAVVICGVIPVMSLFLRSIPGFTGVKTGMVLSMGTAAALLSPLISYFIADKYIKTEKLFAICSFSLFFLLIFLRSRTEFTDIAIIYLFIMLFLTPSSAFLNILIFHFLGRDRRRFGNLRVWATYGWIFMSLFFSYLWLDNRIFPAISKNIGDILYFSGFTALVLGVFSLTLPARNISDIRKKPEFNNPFSGFDVEEKKVIKIFFLINFLIYSVDRYYYLGIAPYLKYAEIQDKWIMPIISAGNISEIVLMYFLFRIINRYGLKKTLAAGAVAEFLRFTIFALSGKSMFLFAGILLHGFTFTLFVAASFIYLDMHCSETSRTSLHLLLAFIASGGSSLAGNMAAGFLIDISLDYFNSYFIFWIFPAIISLTAIVLILVFITEKNEIRQAAV